MYVVYLSRANRALREDIAALRAQVEKRRLAQESFRETPAINLADGRGGLEGESVMTTIGLTQLREAQAHWSRRTARPAIEKMASNAQPATLSGLPLQPLYSPVDFPDDRYAEALGFPGQSPCTRGVQPTMYPRALVDDPNIFGVRIGV